MKRRVCVLLGLVIGVASAVRAQTGGPLSPTASRDPRTPNVTRNTDWEHSLNYTLDQRGLALPDLGGITHQGVGGFLSTGSAGGTCKWSFLDAIVALRCANLHVPDPRAERDALIAATALVHGMTVVTRNTADFEPTGVPLRNPWQFETR